MSNARIAGDFSRREVPSWLGQFGRGLRLAFALAAALLIFLSVEAAPAYETDQQNQAGLVVVHGDGRVVTRCVGFDEDEISGYELLQGSGLDLGIEATAMGAGVCRLDGVGCSPPGQSCFCQCVTSPCLYWSFWRMENQNWQYSNLGATTVMVRPGEIQAWVWSEGIIGREADMEPPAMSFEQVCTPPATPTYTPTSTATETTTPISSPSPTPTFTATSTPWPTAVETSAPTPTWTFTPVAQPVMPTATWTPSPLPPDDAAFPTPAHVAEAGPPQIRDFSADRTQIEHGESVTLMWAVDDADQVILRAYPGGEEQVEAAGSRMLQPRVTTYYALIASNARGETSANVQVFVRPVQTTPAPVATMPVTDEAAAPFPDIEENVARDEPDEPAPDEPEPSVPAESETTLTESFPPESLSVETPSVEMAPVETEAPVVAAEQHELDARLDEPPTHAPDIAAEEAVLSQAQIETPIPEEPSAVALVPPVFTPTPIVTSAAEESISTGSGAATSGATQSPVAEEAARVRLLALLAGSVLILGAPLLFAFVWVVVWAVWRNS